jgi:hypothetical protein
VTSQEKGSLLRYALLRNDPEPADVGITEEDMAPTRAAFGAHAKSLHDSGVLVSVGILQPAGHRPR